MEMSNTVKAGCVLGLVGGIIAMIGLIFFLKEETYAITTMGVYMLAAVMFFALAGAYSATSQWSWKVLMFMNFLTLGVIIGGAIADYYNAAWAAIEAVIGILILVIGAGPAKIWFSAPRAA